MVRLTTCWLFSNLLAFSNSYSWKTIWRLLWQDDNTSTLTISINQSIDRSTIFTSSFSSCFFVFISIGYTTVTSHRLLTQPSSFSRDWTTTVVRENKYSSRYTPNGVQGAFKVLMTHGVCNSHDVSHFAAFFIVVGPKTSVAESVRLHYFYFAFIYSYNVVVVVDKACNVSYHSYRTSISKHTTWRHWLTQLLQTCVLSLEYSTSVYDNIIIIIIIKWMTVTMTSSIHRINNEFKLLHSNSSRSCSKYKYFAGQQKRSYSLLFSLKSISLSHILSLSYEYNTTKHDEKE